MDGWLDKKTTFCETDKEMLDGNNIRHVFIVQQECSERAKFKQNVKDQILKAHTMMLKSLSRHVVFLASEI
jgi:hypothetical protein